MKRYVYSFALLLMSVSAVTMADLDTPELQPKAGQSEMDVAFDMSDNQDDLKAAKSYNKPELGKGYLSIELNPKRQLAQFNLTIPQQEITALTLTQLAQETTAPTLWSSLFHFIPVNTCALQQYQVKPLPLITAYKLQELSINWELACSDLNLSKSLVLNRFTPIAPTLHTIQADWLTPESTGTRLLTLPTTISFDPKHPN